MAVNPYQNITTSADFQIYDFISSGKRVIKKRVKFEIVDQTELIYNLVLFTVLENNREDCENASRNGDMIRVLETVGIIALIYTDRYPKRKIYFTGSDRARTRQYQISIFSQLTSVINYFNIEGLQIEDETVTLRETFRSGKNYDAFIFTRNGR